MDAENTVSFVVIEHEPFSSGLGGMMNALRERNPYGLPIFPITHPRLDTEGALLDAWGRRFHFHPVSRHHLEIRSLGPDGEIFTRDDLMVPAKPREGAR